MPKRYALLLCLTLLAGCGPATRSYTVTVRNDSPEPMTVWLTKDGGPLERSWASPEQIAAFGKPGDVPLTGVIIPPGQKASVGPIEGQFDSGVDAVLRIYRGQQRMDQMLATTIGSPNRSDLTLAPGENLIVIDPAGNAARQ